MKLMCRNAVLYIWKNINQYSAGSHMDERFGKPFFPHFHEVLKLNSWQDEHMIDNTYFRQGMPPNRRHTANANWSENECQQM